MNLHNDKISEHIPIVKQHMTVSGIQYKLPGMEGDREMGGKGEGE